MITNISIKTRWLCEKCLVYPQLKTIVNDYFEEKDPFYKRQNFLHGLDLMCDKFARLSFREFRNAMGDMLVETLNW